MHQPVNVFPCHYPGCGHEAAWDLVRGTSMCAQHLQLLLEPARANKYAVACICYYDLDVSIMPDHLFDGLCAWLLKNESYKRIPFLDEGMLTAGSGYETRLFPPELHEFAAKLLELPELTDEDREAILADHKAALREARDKGIEVVPGTWNGKEIDIDE